MENFLQTENCWTVAPVSVARALTRTGSMQAKPLIDAPHDRTVFMLKRSGSALSEECNMLLGNMKEVVERLGAAWVYAQ